MEEGKGVGVGSTTQWVTMAGCSLDDRAGSGVIKMTMRAVVVVGCGVNLRSDRVT